jgi:uncharacterized protein involved in type VI secretion and phage assembly
MSDRKFYGKYRAQCVNNVDPDQKARIQVIVPDVSNVALSTWAMPCLPVGGLQAGVIAVPVIGAGVWVEFEHGDPDYPVWSGCYWGTSAETPAISKTAPPGVAAISLQTPLQHGILVSDVPGPSGGIMIKSPSGASIVVNDTGIYIQNGKGASITLVGPTVTVNQGALTVV